MVKLTQQEVWWPCDIRLPANLLDELDAVAQTRGQTAPHVVAQRRTPHSEHTERGVSNCIACHCEDMAEFNAKARREVS